MKGNKNMFGGTHVGLIVNRPRIWSPRLSDGQRMSFPNLKKNLYTGKKYINNEVTDISDANRCDQNGAAKNNLWFIWNTNWIPEKIEMGKPIPGFQSPQSPTQMHWKMLARGIPKKRYNLYTSQGEVGPFEFQGIPLWIQIKTKKHWNPATRHRQNKTQQNFYLL